MQIRDAAVYVASKAVPGGLGFATTMLLTWMLAPEEFGVYGLGLAAIAIGNNVLFGWICASFQRWYEGREDNPAFMNTLLAMFAGSCAASAVLLGAADLLGLLGRYEGQAWLFLFGTWSYGWFEFASMVQVGRFRPARYFLMNLARNGLILAGSAAVGYFTRSADVVLAVNFASIFAAGCLYVGDGSIRPRPVFDKALARSFLAYAAPIGVTMVLFGLSNSANRLMLGALSTVEAVADYTVASTLVQNSLGVVSNGIGLGALTAAVRAVEGGDRGAAQAQLARTYTLLLGLLLPSSVGLVMVAPEIASLLIAPHYRGVVERLTPWLALYSVLIGMRAQYVDVSFQLAKKTGLTVRVTAVSAAVNLGLNLLLVPRWGAEGSAAALTLACGISLIYAVFLTKQAHPMPMPARDTWRVAVSTGAMALAVLAARAFTGFWGLLAQIALGTIVYGATSAALDVLGLRQGLARRLGLGARRPAPDRQICADIEVE